MILQSDGTCRCSDMSLYISFVCLVLQSDGAHVFFPHPMSDIVQEFAQRSSIENIYQIMTYVLSLPSISCYSLFSCSPFGVSFSRHLPFCHCRHFACLSLRYTIPGVPAALSKLLVIINGYFRDHVTTSQMSDGSVTSYKTSDRFSVSNFKVYHYPSKSVRTFLFMSCLVSPTPRDVNRCFFFFFFTPRTREAFLSLYWRTWLYGFVAQ